MASGQMRVWECKNGHKETQKPGHKQPTICRECGALLRWKGEYAETKGRTALALILQEEEPKTSSVLATILA